MTAKFQILLSVLQMAGLCAAATPITTLFNTGVASNDSSGAPAALSAQGAHDQHYWIISSAEGAFSPFVTESAGYPFPYWNADSSNSQWISPQPIYSSSARDPQGNYTYETTFDLTGFDTNTVSISGQVAADDTITAIRINGFDIGFPAGAGYSSFTPFSIPPGHYYSGLNHLRFEVLNYPPGDGNPSGFRVELSGTASPLHSSPPSLGVNMYTGVTIIAPVGSTNLIQFATDVNSTNWTTLTNLVLPSSPYIYIDYDSAGRTRRFYRNVLQ